MARLIADGVAAGRIVDAGGLLRVAGAAAAPDRDKEPEPARAGRPMRVVAIDFESVVRTIATKPYTERRAFQVAALRFGRDWSWVRERRSMSRFCALPEVGEGPDWLITSNTLRARHAAAAVDADTWLDELDAVLDGADAVVAYNGLELDFPLLDEERERAGRPPLAGYDLIDGLLLALSLWPNPPNRHRLAVLAERLNVDLERYTWHEALSDCRLLATVIWAGARELRSWNPELVDLLLTVCDDSPAWGLLADLGRLAPSGAIPDEDTVAALLADELASRGVLPVRAAPSDDPDATPPNRHPITVPGAIVGADGRVDPHLLAETANGRVLDRRAAQGQMADTLAAWLPAGHGGLVEAPTGTGKSLVLLAAGLEWVRSGEGRRAVIATHTKQLQNQLARDVQRLVDAGVGVLAGATDLVKGASNRLSLRGLTLGLVDACQPGLRRGPLGEPAQRELLGYLAVRFVTASRITERWLAGSVDPVDVPVIFSRTTRNRVAHWLAGLSQGEQGEYRADPDLNLSLHTSKVREALEESPIIIANHALLLAHREALASLDGELVLLVDEAHELEGAATEALSAVFDYQALERIPGEITRFNAEVDGHPAVTCLVETAGQLRRFLDAEVLPSSALRAFDQLSELGSDPGRRAVTLASQYEPIRSGAPVQALRHSLNRARNYLEFARRMLAWWAAAPDGLDAADRWAAERFRAVSSTVLAQQQALDAILADLETLVGPLRRRVLRTPGSGDDPDLDDAPPDESHDEALAAALEMDRSDLPPHDIPAGDDETPAVDEDPEPDLDGAEADSVGAVGDDAAVGLDEVDAEDDDQIEDPADDDLADEADAPGFEVEGGASAGVPPESNRVVWMAEADSPDVARSKRYLRFSVTTSPIALGADAAWREFLDSTPRLVLTSGTLRVSGSWEFIRARLGLAGTVPAIELDTPFDHAAQARLVCLSDFPSWAEHPARAMRTIAHQLTGWMNLAGGDHPDGGVAGGAMVLTTSRASAAGIAEAAAPGLSAAGVPVATAETLGNARAVDTFATTGGVLIGTRGLWQGVDISDPGRLRLVWINKLPFAPFADPVIRARRAHALAGAIADREADPERAADEAYYLPLAALSLRQAVGRLIRTTEHRGVIVISDNKLSGSDSRRRMYRRVFLGSLEDGLRVDVGGDVGAGNVKSMLDGWQNIIIFARDAGIVDSDAADAALEPDTLAGFVDLPEMVAIRQLMYSPAEAAAGLAADRDAFAAETVERCQAVAGVLAGAQVELRDEQRHAIAAIACGDDLLAMLPTGFGKSFCYQLPALVLPGVTLVVSPLVSLMVDQAMGLGATIGSMIRALTGPMRESNSRLGKTQVAETLRGKADHDIRLIYLSPERLADARFRDLIEQAVESGIVRRIAVDEAHTLVSWGDDFRPSFRRMDRWLAGLKAAHPGLAVSAFTATANRTVREGLRARLFGLPPAEPAGGDRAGFVTVAANPLRADLAIWRRRLAPGGPNAVAGLVEVVVEALDQHAIFYCTTVREVERVHAAVRDYLGEAGADRVLRYHGRLSTAEKSAVATAFKTAGRAGDDDFRPMIVVATSAFGLGVDRPDIRTVFVISPPADLAALYQQLGRAGRDSSRKVPGIDDVPLNAAMALVTHRSWRTVTWMATQDIGITTLRRLADRLLDAAPSGQVTAVDPETLAGEQMLEDVAAGRLGEAALRSARVAEEYQGAVVRALAALGTVGGVDDGGDVPDRVRVGLGEVACDDAVWAQVIDRILADPDATTTGVDLAGLHAVLGMPGGVAGYDEVAGDLTELWNGLAAAHDRGWLDVSQQVTRARLVVYRTLAVDRPAGFDTAVTARNARVNEELRELRAWFDDRGRCAHEGFGHHFGVAGLPEGCCATAAVRCSWHWNDAATVAGDPTEAPALHRAFFIPRPQPMAATATGRAAFERRLRRHISDLLWHEYRGLTSPMLRRVLHGEDSWYSPRLRRRRRLWPSLLHHRVRGAMIGVRLAAVEAALASMAADGQVVEVAGRWRLAEHVAADAARAAREAGRAGAAVADGAGDTGGVTVGAER
ncbi:MAG: DEAD/DEAH box helicase [Acidimicrobiales bacterium]|nr:DEAD/DEAH box helicase [Acidimicrobiales bacterium]